MAYFAVNAVPIGTTWTEPATFRWPYGDKANKISGYINGTDAVVQILEDAGGFQEDQTREILLRQGFNSRDFPPFVACRFKVWGSTQLASSGTIDIVILQQ